MTDFSHLRYTDFEHKTWADMEPYFRELEATALTADNGTSSAAAAWLRNWTLLDDAIYEVMARLYIGTSKNIADEVTDAEYTRWVTDLMPNLRQADQRLKEKFLASGLEPEGFEIPLRNMRAEAALFREANLPLQTQEEKLRNEYGKVTGAQTFIWDGQERPIPGLAPLLLHRDRAYREGAWRAAMDRQLADRDKLNDLWAKFVPLRGQMARNAGYDSYLQYAWVLRQRFDYRPQDSVRFHESVEQIAVPAAKQLAEKQRQRLGVDSLRPWDTQVDPTSDTPLRPFETEQEFVSASSAIFHKLDPQLGRWFDTMRDDDMLDLMSRKNKRPGGYCSTLPASKRPFIFMNSVGVPDNVRTLVHEAGHAFHAFEKLQLPYAQQRHVTAEFNEVASMAMELLTTPFWSREHGGYYSTSDAAKARIEHLEKIISFWPYMAVVDAFQHWAYTHEDQAVDAANCDAAWSDLWDRFMSFEDWSGLDEYKKTGWHRKLHIFTYPFYYVEYGMAQLGSVQIWANMLKDQPAALAAYKRALALGGTKGLPDLYAAAGAKFAFDVETLGEAVELIMDTIEELEGQV